MKISAQNENFVFLNSYSEHSADLLYKHGDLFLMPSSYEPCGLSQMIAMSYGQPCLVHGVGGLKDTVRHAVNGFVFEGMRLEDKVRNFQSSFIEAVSLREKDPEKWKQICSRAEASRFLWKDSACQYIEKLYLQK
jgi:starch synthase